MINNLVEIETKQKLLNYLTNVIYSKHNMCNYNGHDFFFK